MTKSNGFQTAKLFLSVFGQVESALFAVRARKPACRAILLIFSSVFLVGCVGCPVVISPPAGQFSTLSYSNGNDVIIQIISRGDRRLFVFVCDGPAPGVTWRLMGGKAVFELNRKLFRIEDVENKILQDRDGEVLVVGDLLKYTTEAELSEFLNLIEGKKLEQVDKKHAGGCP